MLSQHFNWHQHWPFLSLNQPRVWSMSLFIPYNVLIIRFTSFRPASSPLTNISWNLVRIHHHPHAMHRQDTDLCLHPVVQLGRQRFGDHQVFAWVCLAMECDLKIDRYWYHTAIPKSKVMNLATKPKQFAENNSTDSNWTSSQIAYGLLGVDCSTTLHLVFDECCTFRIFRICHDPTREAQRWMNCSYSARDQRLQRSRNQMVPKCTLLSNRASSLVDSCL